MQKRIAGAALQSARALPFPSRMGSTLSDERRRRWRSFPGGGDGERDVPDMLRLRDLDRDRAGETDPRRARFATGDLDLDRDRERAGERDRLGLRVLRRLAMVVRRLGVGERDLLRLGLGLRLGLLPFLLRL